MFLSSAHGNREGGLCIRMFNSHLLITVQEELRRAGDLACFVRQLEGYGCWYVIEYINKKLPY
jgi:hypothetical protein